MKSDSGYINFTIINQTNLTFQIQIGSTPQSLASLTKITQQVSYGAQLAISTSWDRILLLMPIQQENALREFYWTANVTGNLMPQAQFDVDYTPGIPATENFNVTVTINCPQGALLPNGYCCPNEALIVDGACTCLDPIMNKTVLDGQLIACSCPEGTTLVGNSCSCSSGVSCSPYSGGCESTHPNCISMGDNKGCCV